MKLGYARQHYISIDNGRTWKPKRSFDEELVTHKDFQRYGLDRFKWMCYNCDECGKFHVAKKRRRNRP